MKESTSKTIAAVKEMIDQGLWSLLRQQYISPKAVLDDIAVVEVPDILGGVNQLMHEDYIRGDVVPAIEVRVFEGYQVEEEQPRSILDHKVGDFEDPVLELESDVPQTLRISPADLGPSFPELGYTGNNPLLALQPPLYRLSLWEWVQEAQSEYFTAMEPVLVELLPLAAKISQRGEELFR